MQQENEKTFWGDRLPEIVGLSVTACFALGTWMVLGGIFYILTLNWLVMGFFKEHYQICLELFLGIWTVFGVWFWFFKKRN